MKSLTIPALMTIALSTTPALSQVANDTAVLSPQGGEQSDIYWQGVPTVTDFATKGFVGKAVEELAKSSTAYAAYLNDMSKSLARLQGAAGMDRMLSNEAQVFIDNNTDTVAKLNKNSTWLKQLGNFLQVIDFVSTAAKASAYVVEGDSSGAVAVVAEDVVKKTAEAAGALGLSWAPGGQVAGAYLGEKAYTEYMAPALDAHEERVRASEWNEKYASKPWLPDVKVILMDGTVQTLEPDTFVDKATGFIRRRSPSDQTEFEAKAKLTWRNDSKLLSLEKLRDEGEIDQDIFDKISQDFRDRDPDQPWVPDMVGMGLEKYDFPDELLENIEPQRVTASGGYVDKVWGKISYSITFWNVGSMVKGKGSARLVLNFGGEITTVTGTFSGGPNGLLSFTTEDGTITFQLVSGYSITIEGETTLTVQNPQAFDGWRT